MHGHSSTVSVSKTEQVRHLELSQCYWLLLIIQTLMCTILEKLAKYEINAFTFSSKCTKKSLFFIKLQAF